MHRINIRLEGKGMLNERYVSSLLVWQPQGRRLRERPRRSRMENVKEAIRIKGSTLREVEEEEEVCQDQQQRRQFMRGRMWQAGAYPEDGEVITLLGFKKQSEHEAQATHSYLILKIFLHMLVDSYSMFSCTGFVLIWIRFFMGCMTRWVIWYFTMKYWGLNNTIFLDVSFRFSLIVFYIQSLYEFCSLWMTVISFFSIVSKILLCTDHI